MPKLLMFKRSIKKKLFFDNMQVRNDYNTILCGYRHNNTVIVTTENTNHRLLYCMNLIR